VGDTPIDSRTDGTPFESAEPGDHFEMDGGLLPAFELGARLPGEAVPARVERALAERGD
jgi:hypothetical protein